MFSVTDRNTERRRRRRSKRLIYSVVEIQLKFSATDRDRGKRRSRRKRREIRRSGPPTLVASIIIAFVSRERERAEGRKKVEGMKTKFENKGQKKKFSKCYKSDSNS